jgi:hypothetical protein
MLTRGKSEMKKSFPRHEGQSHIFTYFSNGRLLLGFGIVACGAEGFSLAAPTERRPPKVAWGVTGGLAKSWTAKSFFEA